MPESTSARVERLVRGDVQVCEERQALTQPRVLRGDRLLDLQEQVGAGPDVVDRFDGRAGALVCLVGERAPAARARLDDDVVATLDELSRTRGRQRNPVLLRLDLLGDADPHAAGTIAPQV